MSTNNQELAKQMIEKFGLKTRIDEILNEKDESIIPILTANLAIFAVSATILFGFNGSNLTASILLIIIATFTSLLGSLLNIWYLVRVKTRTEFLKRENEKIFERAETDTIKMFNLMNKVINSSLNQKIQILKEKGADVDELKSKLNENDNLKYLPEELSFIPFIIMELALKNSYITMRRCMEEPLEEKAAQFKLFIDNLSGKSKNWGLIFSSVFILSALLIKFIVK
jgi:hypothetical protein